MRENSDKQSLSCRSMELESLRLEYKNTFERSNKLDNKVYITLTFCGFLVVFITNLFAGVTDITLPVSRMGWIVFTIYVFLWIGTISSYMYLLIYFLKLLKPEGMERLDPDVIEKAHLEKCSEAGASALLIRLYCQAINHNLEKLKTRCDRLTSGLRIVIVHVLLDFLTYMIHVALIRFSL